jgi:hypothetical protein
MYLIGCRIIGFTALLLLSMSVFAVTQDVNVVSPKPLAVYVTTANPAALQTDTLSSFLANVTLGDIWLLQFVIGLIQIYFLGAIHGHQR